MSFSKLAKRQDKNIQINQVPKPPQLNPFQIMESMQDSIAQLSFQLSKLYEIQSNLYAKEYLDEAENQQHLAFTIQLFKERLQTKTERLSNYAMSFMNKAKPPLDKKEEETTNEQTEEQSNN